MIFLLLLLFIVIFILIYKHNRNENYENMNTNYKHDKNKNTNLFVISGNCRTFLSCIDNCIENLINNLDKNSNNEIFFYLKLKDERTKEDNIGGEHPIFNRENIEYAMFPKCEYNDIVKKINEINQNNKFNIYYKILYKDEVDDATLIKQIKNKSLYSKFGGPNVSPEKYLLSALHQTNNAYMCGKYIEQIERHNEYKYSTIIYLRPDMYFENKTKKIDELPKNTIVYMHDHIAVIPRLFFNYYFNERKNIFETNDTIEYYAFEEMYYDALYNISIEYKFGDYYLKRM
jgi:hypothetical protein